MVASSSSTSSSSSSISPNVYLALVPRGWQHVVEDQIQRQLHHTTTAGAHDINNHNNSRSNDSNSNSNTKRTTSFDERTATITTGCSTTTTITSTRIAAIATITKPSRTIFDGIDPAARTVGLEVVDMEWMEADNDDDDDDHHGKPKQPKQCKWDRDNVWIERKRQEICAKARWNVERRQQQQQRQQQQRWGRGQEQPQAQAQASPSSFSHDDGRHMLHNVLKRPLLLPPPNEIEIESNNNHPNDNNTDRSNGHGNSLMGNVVLDACCRYVVGTIVDCNDNDNHNEHDINSKTDDNDDNHDSIPNDSTMNRGAVPVTTMTTTTVSVGYHVMQHDNDDEAREDGTDEISVAHSHHHHHHDHHHDVWSCAGQWAGTTWMRLLTTAPAGTVHAVRCIGPLLALVDVVEWFHNDDDDDNKDNKDNKNDADADISHHSNWKKTNPTCCFCRNNESLEQTVAQIQRALDRRGGMGAYQQAWERAMMLWYQHVQTAWYDGRIMTMEQQQALQERLWAGNNNNGIDSIGTTNAVSSLLQQSKLKFRLSCWRSPPPQQQQRTSEQRRRQRQTQHRQQETALAQPIVKTEDRCFTRQEFLHAMAPVIIPEPASAQWTVDLNQYDIEVVLLLQPTTTTTTTVMADCHGGGPCRCRRGTRLAIGLALRPYQFLPKLSTTTTNSATTTTGDPAPPSNSNANYHGRSFAQGTSPPDGLPPFHVGLGPSSIIQGPYNNDHERDQDVTISMDLATKEDKGGSSSSSSHHRTCPSPLASSLPSPPTAKTMTTTAELVRLRPSTAQLLIHVAQIQSGDIVVDPCAGVGTIPIEATLLPALSSSSSSSLLMPAPSILALGGDLVLPTLGPIMATQYLQQARRYQIKQRQQRHHDDDDRSCDTLSAYSGSVADLIGWDACHVPIRSGIVDVVISDLPFGQQCLSKGKLDALLPVLLHECARLLSPRTGRMVLLCGNYSCILQALYRANHHQHYHHPTGSSATTIPPATGGSVRAKNKTQQQPSSPPPPPAVAHTRHNTTSRDDDQTAPAIGMDATYQSFSYRMKSEDHHGSSIWQLPCYAIFPVNVGGHMAWVIAVHRGICPSSSSSSPSSRSTTHCQQQHRDRVRTLTRQRERIASCNKNKNGKGGGGPPRRRLQA